MNCVGGREVVEGEVREDGGPCSNKGGIGGYGHLPDPYGRARIVLLDQIEERSLSLLQQRIPEPSSTQGTRRVR